MNYQEILDFWFDPKNQSWWFSQNDAFDALIEEKFKTIHQQAAHAELWSWRSSAEGRLAEIIVLDQLSRNLYRNSSLAFITGETAAMALPPQIAVPTEIRNEVSLFIFRTFPKI
jgi:uncharacterized protein (DUF924 family)